MSFNVLGAPRYLFNILNTPVVKESIKNITGTFTFVFGPVAFYDLCKILQGREISTEACPQTWPHWAKTASKTVLVCAKISLVLSAVVSRPGIFILSSIVGTMVSTGRLERIFGLNTTFTLNPWHPRHLVGMAALILALPSLAQTTYEGACWIHRKVTLYYNSKPVGDGQPTETDQAQAQEPSAQTSFTTKLSIKTEDTDEMDETDANGTAWLTNMKVRAMTLFNLVTHECTLQKGFNICRMIVRL